MATVLLDVAGISKAFPGTLALDSVGLQLRAGEIHAVMGENGAGKSTLMKILSGVYRPDSGTIQLQARPITMTSPREALTLGIAIVHQELSVVPPLTVAENIFPGHLPVNRFGFVRYGELFQRAAGVLEQMDVAVDPRALVETLSVANQQLIEITKALSQDCRILILDEPTSALTDREAERLLGLIRRLADERGVGILYISHKLKEIFAVADRVTVLRDGRYVGTENVSDVTPDQLIRMMVGRELGTMYPPHSDQRGRPLLDVRDLRLSGSDSHNSFTLYEGEILGFAGLLGSGRSELMRAIFAGENKAQGEIVLDGAPVRIRSAQEAIRHGIGYLPEDRKAAGLFLDMSIKLNTESAILRDVSRSSWIVSSRERAVAEKSIRDLHIAAPDIEQEVRRLSGGNQQKTLVAKWLSIKPKILIVDEPTRGIDVGAKKDIHYLLRELAQRGVGVIMVSSELPEILGMSDRVLVMRGGRIVAEYGRDADEENIIRSASTPIDE